MQRTIFLVFTLSILVLFMVHSAALLFSLYWIHPWLDIPMHFLGGATVALGYQSQFLISRYRQHLSFGYIATLGVVLAVGLLWEAYEVIVGPMLPGYVFDTSLDVVMDILGGTVGYWVGRAIMKL